MGIFKLLFLPILQFLDCGKTTRVIRKLDNDPFTTVKSDKYKKDHGLL